MTRGGIRGMVFWRGMPVLGLLLFNVTLHMLNASVRLRGDGIREVVPEMTAFFGALVLSAFGLAPLLHKLGEGGGTFFRPFKWRPAALTAALALVVAVRLAGFEPWSRDAFWRFLMLFPHGLLLPVVYTLFFRLTPRNRCGFWYGAHVAAGILCFKLSQLGVDMGADGEIPRRLALLFHLRTALIAIMAAALLCSLLQLRNQLRQTAPDSRETGGEPGRKGEMARLLAAAALFFVMNGFLQGRLFPFFTQNTIDLFPEILAAVALACPLAGLYLDRNPRRGARLIMRLCAMLFMLAPALAVLDMAQHSYRVLLCLLCVARFVISLTAVRTMAFLTRDGPYYPAIVSSVAFLQVVSLAGRLLLPDSLRLNSGLVVLCCIVAAMLIYGSLSRVLVDPPPPDAPPPPADDNDSRQALFAAHQLSQRESEIAAMLIRGASTREMARQLAISEHTVTTHVKNILRKFSLPSRKAFLARFIAQDEIPPPGEGRRAEEEA